MSMEVKRLSGAMGAEIYGIGLSQDLPKKALEKIREPLYEYIAKFFTEQELSPTNITPLLHPLGPERLSRAEAGYVSNGCHGQE